MAGELTVNGTWMVGWETRSEDTPRWTMHPNGECLIVLLTGELSVVIDDENGGQVHELRPGQACIVPGGLWHRTVAQQPSQRIFLTAGEGTQTRPAE
ncbi:MAG: cupin domain-containing protein [Nocardioidaceae bacterium]